MMMYPVVFVAFIAICTGNAVPLAPGNNHGYIEGESRYIWMPDGDGIPHLIDLQEPIDNTFVFSRHDIKYWLFTRTNPKNSQTIVHGDANTIWKSNYNPRRPTNVIVHGWNSNGESVINPTITSALLAVGNVNVIIVDWRTLANSNYVTAVFGVPRVGRFLKNFLTWLMATAGGNWNNVHLVGMSLGAHVVGNAGRAARGRPIRITGLDPAGPLWKGNGNALNRNDGQYVEAIHTDGGVFGILDPIADANFYPNGGKSPQPGCWFNICSHDYAYYLFAATVRFNHLRGRLCSDVDQALHNQCDGPAFNMGNNIFSKKGVGIYGLVTYRYWPY